MRTAITESSLRNKRCCATVCVLIVRKGAAAHLQSTTLRKVKRERTTLPMTSHLESLPIYRELRPGFFFLSHSKPGDTGAEEIMD
jgi:hypothetical protein